jgi:hypothetical protein
MSKRIFEPSVAKPTAGRLCTRPPEAPATVSRLRGKMARQDRKLQGKAKDGYAE